MKSPTTPGAASRGYTRGERRVRLACAMDRPRVQVTRCLLPAVLAALLAAALVACGEETINASQLEQQIKSDLGAQGEIEVESVRCPDDVRAQKGRSFECELTEQDGTTSPVLVDQTDSQGNVTFQVATPGAEQGSQTSTAAGEQ